MFLGREKRKKRRKLSAKNMKMDVFEKVDLGDS
jgi:hypothetical protein